MRRRQLILSAAALLAATPLAAMQIRTEAPVQVSEYYEASSSVLVQAWLISMTHDYPERVYKRLHMDSVLSLVSRDAKAAGKTKIRLTVDDPHSFRLLASYSSRKLTDVFDVIVKSY